MAYSKKPRESLRVYYKRLEQVDSAFAGLQRLSEQLRVGELLNKIYGNLGEPTENNSHFVEGNARHNPK